MRLDGRECGAYNSLALLLHLYIHRFISFVHSCPSISIHVNPKFIHACAEKAECYITSIYFTLRQERRRVVAATHRPSSYLFRIPHVNCSLTAGLLLHHSFSSSLYILLLLALAHFLRVVRDGALLVAAGGAHLDVGV